jgi:UDP-glucose 4-epimerase
MRQKILVSGGGGYVGRTLIRLLYEHSDVCVIDTLRFGAGRFSATDLAHIRLENVDLRDGRAVAAVVGDFAPDVIVHLAAIHYIPECEADPERAISTNVLGTTNLLTAALPGTRFVFASSGAVYRPDRALHNEESSAIEPSDVYGYTKLHGEQLVGYFSRTRGLAGAVVRLFNVVGPGETNPHLLPEIVAQLKAGHSVVRLGNMWPKRDYIHVADAAAGFMAVATRGTVKTGEVATVNLGTSLQYSVEDILTRLRRISNVGFAFEEDPTRVRAVDRAFLGADIARIGKLFGWAPTRGIDDALSDLWRAPDMTTALMAKYMLSDRAA